MQTSSDLKSQVERILFAVIAGLLLYGFYLLSRYNYLLFHSLTEIFSIVIAFSIFSFAWNSRQFCENNYLLFLGLAFLFIGGLDLLHTLAYKGMGVFRPDDANYSPQLWIAARFLQSLALGPWPFFLSAGDCIPGRFLLSSQ
jgi:hypothetical protein